MDGGRGARERRGEDRLTCNGFETERAHQPMSDTQTTAPRDIGPSEQAVAVEQIDGWPHVRLRNGRTLGPYLTDAEAEGVALRFGMGMTPPRKEPRP